MRIHIRTIAVFLLILAGAGAIIYPLASQWVHQIAQNRANQDLDGRVSRDDPKKLAKLLEQARAFNRALAAGDSLSGYDYRSLLSLDGDDVMARLRVPSIDLDQPVRHGMGESAISDGVGHLEYSSLPVGGKSTHAVLGAHRGLASTRGFTDLPDVKVGDKIYLEVLGDALAYRVVKTETLLPDQAAVLPVEEGRDLLTLITCTPIGVNTHRFVVTAERIPWDGSPHPAVYDRPGFAWWAVAGAGVLVLASVYLIVMWRRESAFARAAAERAVASATAEGQGRVPA